jgi:hypothetical protein
MVGPLTSGESLSCEDDPAAHLRIALAQKEISALGLTFKFQRFEE